MTDQLYQRLVVAVLLAFVLAQAVFAAFPRIDLAVSARFAAGTSGFPWASQAPATVNLVLRRLGEGLTVLLILWWCLGAATGSLKGDDLRAWALAPLGVVLSSGGIVNLVLKDQVGRARPADIAEFGGRAGFSPAWEVTRQCSRNCSFTSGEVALAASIAIAVVVLLWPRLGRTRARIAAILLAVAYVGVVAFLRIGLGRHFLSDTIFSTLFSAVVVLVLYRLLGIGRARRAFDPALPLRTTRRWLEVPTRRALRWLRRAS
ncbi:MAG: phosphatase PAP2 family protein [Pseudomonadota bacterium]